MTKHTQSQIDALKNAAKRKRERTLQHVNEALLEMEKNGLPITFSSVAKVAGVSRMWLYNESKICTLISGQKDKSNLIEKALNQKKSIVGKNKEIETLTRRIDAMKEEIRTLKLQLEAAYGELYTK